VWLRRAHPDAMIETQLVQGGALDNFAVFSARVTFKDGGGATGWGSETSGDFRDYLEKAETKAIGRALAAAGFGTQFCDDHEGGQGLAQHQEGRSQQSGQMRIADAPVDFGRRSQPPAQPARDAQQARPQGTVPGGSGEGVATERQLKFIKAVAREAGLDEQELETWTQELYGETVDRLNRRDASALIEALQRRRGEVS
jgi:hypothetical protein